MSCALCQERVQPANAEKFGKELRDKTKQLAEFPSPGRLGRPGLPDWLRELVAYKNCIIFYRVFDEFCTVEILRVKHIVQQVNEPMPSKEGA